MRIQIGQTKRGGARTHVRPYISESGANMSGCERMPRRGKCEISLEDPKSKLTTYGDSK